MEVKIPYLKNVKIDGDRVKSPNTLVLSGYTNTEL